MADLNRAVECDEEVESQVEDMMTYHKWSDEQTRLGIEVRDALTNAIKVIIQDVPPCPDRTVAIRKIREARMDCNSAITHGGRY